MAIRFLAMTKIRIPPTLATDFIDEYDEDLCSLRYFWILVREEFGYLDDEAAFDHARRLVVGMLAIGWARIVLRDSQNRVAEIENPVELLDDQQVWLQETNSKGYYCAYTIIMSEVGYEKMVRISGLE